MLTPLPACHFRLQNTSVARDVPLSRTSGHRKYGFSNAAVLWRRPTFYHVGDRNYAPVLLHVSVNAGAPVESGVSQKFLRRSVRSTGVYKRASERKAFGPIAFRPDRNRDMKTAP